MAAGLSTAANLKPYNLLQPPIPLPKPNQSLLFHPFKSFHQSTILRLRPPRRTAGFSVCVLAEDPKRNLQIKTNEEEEQELNPGSASARVEEKLARKRSQRFTYLVAAVMSSFGVTSMAVFAVYYRFSWQMEGGDFPWSEMLGTFSLSVGAAVAMEFWARWAHRALWHASLWHMHESHHRPREGPFELNDVFAIVNAVPAIALLSYGLFHKGLVPGLCFGAGLGITVFGMAYMFVHDGLVHKRFPVGPIANVPYFRRVAAAHQLHHTDKFNGVPYGLFLGPRELEEVGGVEELEKEISRRIRSGS
ncbi:beta-carotene hydroxylase 2, chloroplastic-like [Vigna unguiculata]|uniref:beta-carotene 3-hydroxylase n=1 Tax=Vigna unguiculata TaxID=3917 RepID=A0A4D6N5M1_VIGUN|nr:beta-carotene hydroxylase 2, chloroplastic-like [Vigna unguiculata]QCE08153.1 beta-carotene hydroxylase [Vigna unguiculata]QCE08154.1 beta-carotene hydroxylase [Vigna unguiculata]